MLDNINPKEWGESFWKTSHYITIAYPINPTQEDKKYVKQYFETLQYVLPCEKCRIHYKQNLVNYPLTDDILSSRDKLIAWLVSLHNEVNRRLNKKEMTVQEVLKQYNVSDINNTQSNDIQKQDYTLLIIVLTFLLIALLIYYAKNKDT